MRIYSVCTVFVLLLAASVCDAAIVTYSGIDVGANSSDPRPNSDAAAASFDSAAGGLGAVSVIDFESAPVGAFTNLSVAPGVSINGSDFGSSPQTIRDTPVATPDGLYGYNVTPGGSNFISLFGGSVTFSFTNAVQAFGFYYSGIQLVGETINFSDGTQQQLVIPFQPDGVQFIGFTDAGKSISSITIDTHTPTFDDIVGIDDVRFVLAGGTSAVPEPATLTIWGLGAIGCAAAAYRRRRKQAA